MAGKQHNEYRVTVMDPYARELLPGYLERRKAQIAEMSQALREGDFERLARAGHGLHGSGAAYGLDRVSVIGNGLELAAHRQDRAGVQRRLDELSDYLEHLKIL